MQRVIVLHFVFYGDSFFPHTNILNTIVVVSLLHTKLFEPLFSLRQKMKINRIEKNGVDHLDGALCLTSIHEKFTFHSITIDVGQYNNYGGAAMSGTWLNRNIFILLRMFLIFDFTIHWNPLEKFVTYCTPICHCMRLHWISSALPDPFKHVNYVKNSPLSLSGKSLFLSLLVEHDFQVAFKELCWYYWMRCLR